MTPDLYAEYREPDVVPGFCPTLPLQPLIWDATRIKTAMTCWRKHYYSTCRGLRKSHDDSIHRDFGTAYHECVEAYDRTLLNGGYRADAVAAALKVAKEWTNKPIWGTDLDVWTCTDPELVEAKRIKVWRRERDGVILDSPDRNSGEWVPKMIENRDRCKHAKGFQPVLDPVFDPGFPSHCACGRPVRRSKLFVPHNKKKTPATLLAAVEAYCASATSITPYKFPDGLHGLELQVSLPLPIQAPNGEYYELLGNIDSLVTWEGEIAIRERKTTGRAFDWRYWVQFDPDPQIDTYDLLGSVLFPNEDGRPPRIMVEATRIVNGNTAEIERRAIYIPESRREEWYLELQNVIIEAEHRAALAPARAPEAAFQRNTSACRQGFFTCAFLDLCQSAPAEREYIIETNYHVERWDPEARGVITEETEE